VTEIEMQGDIVVELRSSAVNAGADIALEVTDEPDELLASPYSLRSEVASVAFPASAVNPSPGSPLDSVLTVTLPIDDLELTGAAAAVAALTLNDGSRLSTYTKVTPEMTEVEVPLRPAIMLEAIEDLLPSELSWEVFVMESENPWQASSGPLGGIDLSQATLDPWYMYQILNRNMGLAEVVGGAYSGPKIPVVLVHGWNLLPDPWLDFWPFDPQHKIESYWQGFAEVFFDEADGYWADYFDLFAFRYDEDRRVTYSGQLLRDALGTLFPDTPVIAVAHSMGGLVSRHALVDYGGDAPIHALITLATPHHGSPLAIIPGAFTHPMGDSSDDLVPDGELDGDVNSNPVLSAMNSADDFAGRYVVYREMYPWNNPLYLVGAAMLDAYYIDALAPFEVGSDGVVPHGSAEFRNGGSFRGTNLKTGGDHSSICADDDNETISTGVLFDLLDLAYPTLPADPSPPDGAGGIGVTVDLAWSDCNRFGGSGVEYDLYFGDGSDPPFWTRTSDTSHTMNLIASADYYWRVTAVDPEGDTNEGPVWSFTTGTATNTPPDATITSPSEGATYDEGVSIQFIGSVDDNEDDPFPSDWMVWTSSRDGQIGTGESFSRSDLSVGSHTITLTATDSGYLTDTETVSITVTSDEPPPVGSFVLVPSGSFTMGDGVSYCGVGERAVTLTRDFWLGQYEVTNQEYLDLVQWAYDRGYVTATSSSVRDALDGSTQELVDLGDGDCEIAFSGGVFTLSDAGHGVNGDHPMKEVTWYGSASYCDWLSLSEGLPRAYDHSDWSCGPGGNPYAATGYRLPTDAEWEYAAQWNDERIYPWGDDAPDCSRTNYGGCVVWTSPVGSYPTGAQNNHDEPIYDLSGNVWEWANDWRECDLGTSPETDPPGPGGGSGRVLRGGSWGNSASSLRVAYRSYSYPVGSTSSIGFRPARSFP